VLQLFVPFGISVLSVCWIFSVYKYFYTFISWRSSWEYPQIISSWAWHQQIHEYIHNELCLKIADVTTLWTKC